MIVVWFGVVDDFWNVLWSIVVISLGRTLTCSTIVHWHILVQLVQLFWSGRGESLFTGLHQIKGIWLLFDGPSTCTSSLSLLIGLLKRGCRIQILCRCHPFWSYPTGWTIASWPTVLTNAEVSPSLATPLSPSLFTPHQLLYRASLKRGYIEFGVVWLDSAIVVWIHSAIIQILLTRRVSYC